jgi:hypothetical protein
MPFHRVLLLTIVLLVLPLSGRAQIDDAFKSITWTPAQLASGSLPAF